ncbi:MAG TPA: hypothetical protein VNJ01_04700 [Bacteriovoracaceae bacterium]|nr:hypothetical protein [Bacteriovoracaceae bacterium]
MMKMIVSIPLTILLLSGCGITWRKTQPKDKRVEGRMTQRTEKKTDKKQSVEKKLTTDDGASAIWNLHTQDIGLILKSLETGEMISLELETGVNQENVPEGEWSISSFTLAGTGYYARAESAAVNFTVKPESHVYAGSLVIACPSVGKEHLVSLKKMRYFNRYSFKSQQRGLCELIVGNDFAKVTRTLKKDPKTKDLNVLLGL